LLQVAEQWRQEEEERLLAATGIAIRDVSAPGARDGMLEQVACYFFRV